MNKPTTTPTNRQRTLAEFLRALAEALTLGIGPLTGDATPGLHQGALVWGALPRDGAP